MTQVGKRARERDERRHVALGRGAREENPHHAIMAPLGCVDILGR
jgi:hypothetical protein